MQNYQLISSIGKLAAVAEIKSKVESEQRKRLLIGEPPWYRQADTADDF